MAHEITNTDNVVLHRKAAWHGLGIVVEDAPTPREALTLAGLDWGVRQKPLFVIHNGEREMIETHVANYREDTGLLLGVVSANYKPVQNYQMADFAQALREAGDVRCETAGSIRGGKRVWFLLKGEPFDVAKGDLQIPYVCLSNGHDGMSTFRLTPTFIRAVCSNTLHGIIPYGEDNGLLGDSAISIRHTQNIMERLEDAKKALAHYGKTVEETKAVMNVLASKDVTKEEVQQFFLECYTADFGDIPTNPTNGHEERRREKSMSAFNSFSRRFDDEKNIAGTSIWCALNAYTGMVSHDLKARGQDDEDRIEKRADSNMFGLNQKRAQSALKRAYQFALAS